MPVWPVIVFLIVALICLIVGFGPFKATAGAFIRVLFYIFLLAGIVTFIFYNVFPPAANSLQPSPPYTPVGR